MPKVIERPTLPPPPHIESPKIAGINMDSLMHKFAVEAFNNEVSTFEAVMDVFTKTCHYDKDTALMYTRRIHRSQSAVCFWGTKEKCETVIVAFTKIGVKAVLREG